jgi:predicted dehydrogenase
VWLEKAPAVEGEAGVLLVGAGWFARTFHLPNLAREGGLRLAGVVSGSGANARQTAEKMNAPFAGTDLEDGLRQPGVDAALICTRHNLHVPQALAAIRAGKHVLLEKPMALDAEGLRALADALRQSPVRFAVGFNRRHAPLARELKDLLGGRTGPLHATYRMNAGRLPADHWSQDPVEGGGRLVGEGCHLFDFCNFLTGSSPVTVQASRIRSADPAVRDEDNITATVTYEDGSVCTVLYTTAGPAGYPKELIEVFAPGFAATLTDYKDLAWTVKRSDRKTLRTGDKGQAEEMNAWAAYLGGKTASVVDFPAAALSTWLTLQAQEAARTRETLPVAASLPGILGE